MIDQLESNYNCANASQDLYELKREIAQLQLKQHLSSEEQQLLNRCANQMSFIKNKCAIDNGREENNHPV
ncbi:MULTISPECIES: DUF2524 domain-containing protein [Paenibacillus]|uniref:DUF2524 domain-containing protein n=1 Tax=Paenibacillus sambharensis TaxID=1803190 RepID=A0A2W1LFP1_9BACL|nr:MULTISPECIES: DUF2524 domain-containing protein [Paenibacillus]MCF2942157.1 DUF2524 domain-containing protein [Paenibacillus tarimensis]PZD93852.1 DUF2524 domain-containing protein [Paenibacillus sambharensis]